MLPSRRETYRYTDEAAYFDQYADALYGVTMRKAGVDCLRHYEILASGSVPYFLGMPPPHHLPYAITLRSPPTLHHDPISTQVCGSSSVESTWR